MVTADKSFQLFACKYIGGQLQKLCSHIDEARHGAEVESVHQSRVASRRLRTAFDIFQTCFPAKIVKKWQKAIKSLTKGLGEARDADVQIMFLRGMLEGFEDDNRHLRPGIERLMLRSEQVRQELQGDVIKSINKLESKTTLADIHSTIERMKFCLRNDEFGFKSDYVFRITRKHIKSRLDQLRSYEKCLEDPGDIENHHDMRIVAKGLRYSIEICSEPYEGKLEESLKSVKKIQSLLGDIHDCDVWAEKIDEFMIEERRRTVEYFGIEGPYYLLQPGLEYIQKHYHNNRRQVFDELVGYWGKLKEEKMWDGLISVLQEPLQNSIKAGPGIVEIKAKIDTAVNGENTEISFVDGGHPLESGGAEGGAE